MKNSRKSSIRYEDENTEEVFFLTELGKQVKDIEAMEEINTLSGKTN